MNKDEFHGGVRYATGKVEKAVGDTVNSRDWQVDGVVDQVAAEQHMQGRAEPNQANQRVGRVGQAAADLQRIVAA